MKTIYKVYGHNRQFGWEKLDTTPDKDKAFKTATGLTGKEYFSCMIIKDGENGDVVIRVKVIDGNALALRVSGDGIVKHTQIIHNGLDLNRLFTLVLMGIDLEGVVLHLVVGVFVNPQAFQKIRPHIILTEDSTAGLLYLDLKGLLCQNQLDKLLLQIQIRIVEGIASRFDVALYRQVSLVQIGADRFQASEHGISSGIGWFELFPLLYYLLDEKTRALQEIFEKAIDIRLCYIYLHQRKRTASAVLFLW